MKERPILFTGPMIRAIREGRKTQTRRLVKPQPSAPLTLHSSGYWLPDDPAEIIGWKCPCGAPGDRLWCKETWRPMPRGGTEIAVEYRADASSRIIESRPDWLKPTIDRMIAKLRWVSSIHMPRWASRLTLEIVSVRVERLQDISEADAIAEGVECTLEHRFNFTVFKDYTDKSGGFYGENAPVLSYRSLWESINGPGSWHANPYVWRIEFLKLEGGAA